MSLIPLSIRWVDETHFAPLPTASYGVIFTGIALAYLLLERTVIAVNDSNSKLARAVGKDRKAKISLVIYLAAIFLAFLSPWIAVGLYILNAALWFIPDRRIESVI